MNYSFQILLLLSIMSSINTIIIWLSNLSNYPRRIKLLIRGSLSLVTIGLILLTYIYFNVGIKSEFNCIVVLLYLSFILYVIILVININKIRRN